MDKILKYIIPFAIFFALISFLWKGVNFQNDVQEFEEQALMTEQQVTEQQEKPSLKTHRAFQLPTVTHPNKVVTQDIFKGHVTILNTWASWCGACRKGHDALLGLSKEFGVDSGIYWVGLNLNDKLEDAQWMLDLYGNPYHETIYDQKGQLSVTYGLRGTPELLILDKEGGIQYRHRG